MAKELFYTALDIGSNKVSSIVARVGSEGELKVLGTGLSASHGIQKGQIESIEEATESVRCSLDESQRYIARGLISGVYAVVSGSHISSINTKNSIQNVPDVGAVTPNQLHKLIQSAYPGLDNDKEILHIIPIQYEVDGLPGVRNPAGLHAKEVQVESHVLMGDKSILRNTVTAIENNKIPVNSLVMQSLASAEATLTADEREMGAVLVDLGSGTTDLCIFMHGNPWYSTVIPVGGNQITRDLAVAAKLPYHLAEELKIKWGHVLPELIRSDQEVVIPGHQGKPKNIISRRSLAEPMHMRMLEVIKLIMLKITQSGLRQLPTGGLILTGGTAEIAGLKELVEKTVGGPVRIAYPNGIAGLPSQLRKPAYSASVGALLWGIKHQGEGRRYPSPPKNLWNYQSLVKRLVRNKQEISN